MQSIMFSTAARGTHIYQPAHAPPASTFNEPEDEGSMTMVSPQALSVEGLGLATGNSHIQVAGGSTTAESAIAKNTTATSTTAESTAAEHTAIDKNVVLMDVDKSPVITSHPTSTSSGKHLHSAMSRVSDEPSSMNITTPIISDRSGKKPNRGRGASRSQSCTSAQPHASSSITSTKISPAAAMVGMQAQIGRLTDVFEKSMTTPENGLASQRSLAITRLQDVDDDLSMSDKVRLIGLFQRDAVTAQTYLDLIHDDVRQAWLHSILDDN
jgi:hypothetical protein